MKHNLTATAAAARLVRGAGGKGGGGGGEAADTLRSTQIADIVDLLGEGEIEGLTRGLKSIYYDGVPLQNDDGSFNFEDVQITFTPGTQGQPAITGGDGVQLEVPVAVDVLAATPVVRTITNPAIDLVRVTISVPQLSETDTGSGDIRGSSFEWAIDVQSDGGGYVEWMREKVDGKSMSRYTRAKLVVLTGSAPWDIRVRRISADAGSAYTVNAFSWASYTEIQSLRLRHPNSAMVRHRISARQFSRLPVRSFDVMGLRVPVPTNYDPLTKTYTGVWDGTFKIAWTDCPAWVFNAVVTNPRWGLGRYFNAGEGQKWQLYRIGQYCDGMVSDGRGGMEPRFRCGVQLTTREGAYKVLTDLAAIFRGMAYWMNTELVTVQDAPSDPVMLYTPANVVDGKFTYSGSSHSKRPSQVTVWFNDMTQQGRLVPEVVVDRDFERRYGVRPMKDLSPLGVWSRAQARRIGRWALYSEHREGQAVAFTPGLDAALVAPGSTFLIADPNEAGERLGGRVRSASASAVTLDKPVTLASGEAYTLTVMLQDAANPAKLVPQTRPVTNAPGPAAVLNVFPAFSAAPAAETVWIIQSDAVQATMWRCLGVKEVAGKNQYEIAGLRHDPQKYPLIDEGIDFEPAPVSRITTVPPRPEALVLMETVYSIGEARRGRVLISWEQPAPGLTYQVSWRLGGGTWTDMPLTSANAVDLDGLAPGLLEVTVRSRNVLGRVSPPVMEDLELVANATPGMQLVVSSGSFGFDAAGAPRPSSQTVAISARPISLAGAVSFVATGFNAAGASLGVLALSGTGDQRTLSVAAFGAAAYATIVASIGAYSASTTITRVQDGAAGLQGSNGLNTARLRVYLRSASLPSVPSAPVTYTFATGAAVGLTGGWSVDLPAGTDPLYVTEATATGAGTTDTINSGEWAAPVILARDGTDGQNGLNGAPVLLFQRTATSTPPAVPSVTTTYTFATGGLAGVNNGWSRSMPASGGAYRWMTSATALSAGPTDSILSGEWADPGLIGQDGQDGASGLNTARITIYRRNAITTPSPPTDPVTYNFTTGAVTGLPSVWTTTAPPTDGTWLWASVATAVSSGNTDTINPGEWSTPVVLVRDGVNGDPGENGAPGTPGLAVATIFLFQRTSTLSTPPPPADTLTYNFATGFIAPLTGGWSQTLPTAGGDYAWMTTATASVPADQVTDDITNSEWAPVSLLAQGGASGFSVFTGTIYKQQLTQPATPTGGSFNFSSATLTPPFGWLVGQPSTTSTPTWASEFTFQSGAPGSSVVAGTWTTPVIDAVAGADGTSVLTVEIYQQSGSAPSAPAGGSYNFSTDTLTPPAGWTRSMPASSTTPTYRSAFTFSTTNPAVPVVGGSWSSPVVVALNGSNGAAGLSNALVTVYQRAASAPALPSATVTYTFASASIAGLNNGWSATPPSGTLPLWVTVATASSSSGSDTIASGEWASPVIQAQNGGNGLDGDDGLNSATIYLFQRTNSPSAPALPSENVTYTFGSGAAAGVNNGWSQTLPTSGGTRRWVTTATALSTGATDTILPGEWAVASLLAEDGEPGAPGAPANKVVRVYQRSASTPATPSGGGVPSGWTVSIPAANGLPLYMTESTQTPADAIVVDWSAPVRADATPSPGPVANLGSIAASALRASGTAAASLALSSNGAISQQINAGSIVTAGFWYSPATAGVGTGRYVKVSRTSGATLSGGSSALDTWLELTSDRTYLQSRSTVGISQTYLQVLVASDSQGANIISAGIFVLEAIRE